MQQFELKTDREEERLEAAWPAQETPQTRPELDTRIAAYRELGLSEQDAIADLKGLARQETVPQQRPARRKMNRVRAFAETSAAIGVTALLMRLAGWLVIPLARAGSGHLWPVALLLGAVSCVGIGYIVETAVPRRAIPAILVILALYLGAFGSEAAFYGYIGPTLLAILFAYSLAGAGLGLAGARLSRRRRERRARRRMLPA